MFLFVVLFNNENKVRVKMNTLYFGTYWPLLKVLIVIHRVVETWTVGPLFTLKGLLRKKDHNLAV